MTGGPLAGPANVSMKNKLRVLALVPYPPRTTPSQRYRIEQWQPFLERAGITLELSPFATDALMKVLYKPGHLVSKAWRLAAAFTRRSFQLSQLGRYDAVLIHRAACLAGPALLERAISLLGKPVIFDFDDAIYLLHTTSANETFGWLKFPGKTASICRASTHVVVGNSHLADYVRQYNDRVTVIPSSVDTARYHPTTVRRQEGTAVVGWMGSSTSQMHLEAFAPLLRQLQSHLDFELRVVSDRHPVLPGVRSVWRPWSAETEIQELSEFDIGIMPMPDDQWTRGKCAMKALLYMAMGIPVICSAVGTNREVIEHGRSGLLAVTDEDWHAQLEELLLDRGERIRLGAAGRETVEQHYSMERCAASFAEVVEQAVANGRSAEGHQISEPHIVGEGRSVSRN